MAKVTHHGSAKPDDPIYKQGLQVFAPMSRQSISDSPKSTDGEEPMLAAMNGMEDALDEMYRQFNPQQSGNTDKEPKDR